MNPMPAPGASLAEMVDWLAAHNDAVADGTAAPLTETQLLDLARRADVTSGGPTDGAIFYSGKGPYDANASAQALKAQAGVPLELINDSVFAQLAESREFKTAYHDATGNTLGWGDPLDPGVKWNNDLWATASARYAAAARGDVIVLLPQDGADWTRVFGTVELPGLLANTAVDTINGISRDSLVRAWENTRSDALANGFTPDEARQHALLGVFDDRRSQGSARVRVPGR